MIVEIILVYFKIIYFNIFNLVCHFLGNPLCCVNKHFFISTTHSDFDFNVVVFFVSFLLVVLLLEV